MHVASLITRTSGRLIRRLFQRQTQLANSGRKKAGFLMDTRLLRTLDLIRSF